MPMASWDLVWRSLVYFEKACMIGGCYRADLDVDAEVDKEAVEQIPSNGHATSAPYHHEPPEQPNPSYDDAPGAVEGKCYI